MVRKTTPSDHFFGKLWIRVPWSSFWADLVSRYGSVCRLLAPALFGLGDVGIPQGCRLRMFYFVVFHVPWCGFLQQRVRQLLSSLFPQPLQLYAISLEGVSRHLAALFEVAWFTVRFVGFVLIPGNAGTCVREAMGSWSSLTLTISGLSGWMCATVFACWLAWY